MSQIKIILVTLCSLFLVTFVSVSHAKSNDIIVQLPWEHEFRFAGIYAAAAQGYFHDEGLDVEIRSAFDSTGNYTDPITSVQNKEAHFGIIGSQLIAAIDAGAPLTVVTPIFQKSAQEAFTTKPNETPRLVLRKNSTELLETAAISRLNDSTVIFGKLVERPAIISDLIDIDINAIVSFGPAIRYQAFEQGMVLKTIFLSANELDVYGDTLFTHNEFAQSNPEMVDAFHRATLKGWLFALNNKADIARYITRNFARQYIHYGDAYKYNLWLSKEIDTYLGFPEYAVGNNMPERWQHASELLARAQLIDSKLPIEQFVVKMPDKQSSVINIVIIAITLALLLLYGMVYFRHSRVIYPLLLVSFLAIAASLDSYLVEKSTHQQMQLGQRQLDALTARVTDLSHHSIGHLSSLAAFFAASEHVDHEEFKQFGSTMFQQERNRGELGYWPDNKQGMLFNGRTTLLLDKEPDPAPHLMSRVIQNDELAVRGPYLNTKGDSVFTAYMRLPSKDHSKANAQCYLSVTFDEMSLYENAGIKSPSLTIDLAIRGADATGALGKVFYGDPDIFSNKNAMFRSIRAGDGSWEIGATVKDLGAVPILERSALWVFTTILCLAAMLLVAWQRKRYEADSSYQATIVENERLLRDMSTTAQIGAWRLSGEKQKIEWSIGTPLLLSLPPDTTKTDIGSLVNLFEHECQAELRESFRSTFLYGESIDLELRLKPNKGGRWLNWTAQVEVNDDGSYSIRGAVQDITERKEVADVIEKQARCDSLTGLPNRAAFYETIKKEVCDARKRGQKLAVLFIDLDKFKPVNDTYGHEAGDFILVKVAERIKHILSTADTVARISGDEFAVILPDADAIKAKHVAANVVNTLKSKFALGDKEIYCGSSIGIAIYPDDGIAADDLVAKADFAMYEVKKSGRNSYKYFTAEMQNKADKRNEMLQSLQAAIAHQSLDIALQPIVEMASQTIVKCEALARWYTETGEQVPTQTFIELAEETNLVNEIDLFVLQAASTKLKAINEELDTPIGLSVNVSPRLFNSSPSDLERWLSLAKDAACNLDLTVEITESLLIQGPDTARKVLTSLKASGAEIAIDDFGTGYSSLRYLTQLPIDYLKIDRSFVQPLSEPGAPHTLVNTIVQLAQNLGIQVIAEGVETEKQYRMLRKKSCKYGQGYYWHKPVSPDEFLPLITLHTKDEAI